MLQNARNNINIKNQKANTVEQQTLRKTASVVCCWARINGLNVLVISVPLQVQLVQSRAKTKTRYSTPYKMQLL